MQAVHRAAHGVAQQAARHGVLLELGVQLERGVEGLLAGTVLHQFHAPEEAAAAHVAHRRVVAERALQHLAEGSAVLAHLGQQAVALDHLLHRQRGRTGHGVTQVGVAVLEEAAAGAHGLHHPALGQHRADGLVAAAQALGDGHQVGHHAFLLAGVQRAGAAHAAHHLVQDQQHAVAVADLAHGLEVAGHRRQHAGGGATHGFCHEGQHLAGADAPDRLVQLLRQTLAVLLGRFAFALLPVGVAGRHVGHIDQQRRELLAAPGVAAHGQRAQRVAVVALAPGDEVAALGLADLQRVLARHLQRRLHRLGAAADEVGVAHAGRGVMHQLGGQRLGHLGGEEAGVRIGQPVDLRVHGGDHVRVAMPQARDGGAAGGVDVAPAGAVDQVHAFSAHGHGRCLAQRTVEDVGAGHASFRNIARCDFNSVFRLQPNGDGRRQLHFQESWAAWRTPLRRRPWACRG